MIWLPVLVRSKSLGHLEEEGRYKNEPITYGFLVLLLLPLLLRSCSPRSFGFLHSFTICWKRT